MRECTIKKCLDMKEVEEEDRKIIQNAFSQYNMYWYGIRATPLLGVGIMLQFGMLLRPSKFLVKELGLIVGLTGCVIAMDTFNSDNMWDKSGNLVTKYVNYSDSMMIDEKKLE